MKRKEVQLKEQIVKSWCEHSGEISLYSSLSSIYSQIMETYKLSVDYIESHSELIDWKALSKNETILWDMDLISNHENEWDWEALSQNKGIKHNKELHNKFIGKWDFIDLIETGKIVADKYFIIKNKKFIGHSIMRLYYPCSFKENLIKYPYLSDHQVIKSYSKYLTPYKTYQSYLDWDQISEIVELINSKDFLIKFKKHLNWSKASEKLNIEDSNILLDILHHFEDYFDWWHIRHNPCCYKSEDVLSAFPEKMKDWWAEKKREELILQQLREEHEKKCEEDFNKDEGWLPNEDFETKKFYPNGHFSRGEIKRMLADENQFWDEELLASVLKTFYSQKGLFDWWKFSERTNVNWNINLLTKYKKYLNWRSISENPSIIWDEVLLDKFKSYLDWSALVQNPNIKWNKKLLLKYKRYLIWRGLDKDESPIYKTRALIWDVSILTSLRKSINWATLFENPDIHWTKDIIYTNKYYWFKAFNGGSFETKYGLKVDWDLYILSKIKDWGSFINSVGFRWTAYKDNGLEEVSWLSCIIPYITYDDIEKIFKEKENLKQLVKESSEEMKREMEAEEEFNMINQEKIEQESESWGNNNSDEEYFDEMTDGQYGSYNDWIEQGKSLDDLKDILGR